jgi:ubiquinone/menaquinone biosynthesis C-methylase UbiE
MQRPTFIARQASRPSGLVGRALGAIMFFETRAFNVEVLSRLAIRPGQRILEIGFGHGRTLERAAAMHSEATFAGIDHAEDMVKALARRCAPLVKSGRLELSAGDSAALPWSDASFDSVFAVHTLYFWPQPERDVAEIARVLKPGGRLLLAFRKKTPDVEAAFPAEIYRFRSEEEVTALLRGAGLTVEMFEGPQEDLCIAEGRRP